LERRLARFQVRDDRGGHLGQRLEFVCHQRAPALLGGHTQPVLLKRSIEVHGAEIPLKAQRRNAISLAAQVDERTRAASVGHDGNLAGHVSELVATPLKPGDVALSLPCWDRSSSSWAR